MSKFKMNCGYCGRKCNMETDFCIPQDSVYICKKCYEWQDKVSKLEDKLKDCQKPKEIRFNGFVVDCNYEEARKVLQEHILKMQEENKKLKESEELSNYAKLVLENKILEEDLKLSEKCCVEYEQEIKEYKKHIGFKGKEITELKQQLALTQKALKLACEEMIEDLQFDGEDDRYYTLQENIEYFKTMAKKEIKDSE